MPKEFIPEPDQPASGSVRTKADAAKQALQNELKESTTEIVLNESHDGEIGLG